MILFQNDWYTQDAIPHVETKNTSFIKMHHILKKMDIKNNAFFLALHDKELLNIDPHSLKDPSKELATRISIEITRNPWYFVREVVRLPASGIDSVHFQLNRANLFLIWSFYNSISTFLIEPRQTGKTITMSTISNHLIYFLYKKTGIFLYAKDNDLIYDNVDRIKTIRDELPPYLIKIQRSKDTENKSSLYYAKRETVFQTKAAQNSISSAFNVGRGKTYLPVFIDEGPFCKNIQISYPVMMNSANKAREFARKNHIPFGNIFITTAGVLDSNEGKFSYDLMNKACFFTEDLYDCKSNVELKYIIEKNSINKMLYGEFSPHQLGYDDEWIKNIAIENNLSEDEIKRDLLNQWTTGTNVPVIPTDILEKLDTHKEHPIHTENYDGYIFRWYVHPDEVFRDTSRYFVLGMDTSENIGNDFTTTHLLAVDTLETIMTSKCNDQDLLKLADYVSKFLIKHPNVTFIPENKSTATVLIPIIIKNLIANNINPFTRIFNRVVQNRSDPIYSKMDISDMTLADGPYRKHFGYKTTGSGEFSRDNLYKLTLKKVLSMAATKIRDIPLIQELKTMTLKNGRIDHTVNGHDDATMSLCLSAFLPLLGKNLHVYGIPTDALLSKVSPTGEEVNMSLRTRQRDLKKRLTLLKSQIDSTTHLTVKNSLQREYRAIEDELSRDFKDLPDETQTVDTHQQATKRTLSDKDLRSILGNHYSNIRDVYSNQWNI